MKLPPLQSMKPVLIGAAVLVVAGVVIFVLLGTSLVSGFWHKSQANEPEIKEEDPAELVRNAKGQPVFPPALRLSPMVAKSLEINSATIVETVAPTKPRALPPQMGTLAYDSDRLVAVRSRFPGEVTDLPDAPPGQRLGVDLGMPRPFAVGDRVKQGDLLAVVWSQALGDKKAALVDALIDLKRDQAYLKDVEKLYYDQGAVSRNTLLEAERTVQKDTSARNAAEFTLRMWKLSEEDIEYLYKLAQTIDPMKRDPKKEKDWARVEIRAYKDGVIVEKNTHLGDWVDPANYNTPMYRMADLSKVQVWIKPAEEYLPILQTFLNKPGSAPLKWDIFLQADPKSPPLDGTLVRIGPSLDPNEHVPLLVGLVENPNGTLLIGQFVTATIYVPVEKGLVEIPTSALNEQKGQSVLFVQPEADKLEFRIKAVSVVHRFKDVVYVRSTPPEDVAATLAPGTLPIEALTPGERVVTESVVELTSALRDLLSKGEPAKSK